MRLGVSTGIRLGSVAFPSGTAYPSLRRNPSPVPCQFHTRTLTAAANTAALPRAWPIRAAESLLAWPAQVAREENIGTGNSRTEPTSGPVGRPLVMDSRPRPIACSEFQETIGSRARDSDPNPCRQRFDGHIRVRNLCSPHQTPTICALAQNIRIPCSVE